MNTTHEEVPVRSLVVQGSGHNGV